MNPWERQPGETDRAWLAFSAYRDLGPERTVSAAAATIGHRSVGCCARWAAANDWAERVTAYDAYCLAPSVEKIREELASRFPQAVADLFEAAVASVKRRIEKGDATLTEIRLAFEYIGTWIRQSDSAGVLDLHVPADASEDEIVEALLDRVRREAEVG